MDGQDPEHPVVVLAQVALGLLRRPVLGDRGDREERPLAPVQRARRIEHRPTERAQEDRGPADLEGILGQAHQVALATERLDPGELLAAPVQEVPGRLMLDGDRVEDRPDRRAVVGRRLAIGAPGRPELAGDPDHLGPDRHVLALRAFEDPGRAQLGVLEGVTHLRREQLRRRGGPRPRSAGRTTSRRWTSRSASARPARRPRPPGGGAAGRPPPGRPGPTASPAATRVVDELDDPGQLLEGRLGVEAG